MGTPDENQASFMPRLLGAEKDCLDGFMARIEGIEKGCADLCAAIAYYAEDNAGRKDALELVDEAKWKAIGAVANRPLKIKDWRQAPPKPATPDDG